MYFCCLCRCVELSREVYLCSECLHSFGNGLSRLRFGVRSLYPYHHEMRQLILGAKVKSRKRELFSLVELVVNHPKALSVAKEVDFVMPASSSLFSRLRGRYDIAWFLAEELGRKAGVPIRAPPLRLSFRVKKRAGALRKGERFQLVSYGKGLGEKEERKPRLLLVDDVFTTGFTLNLLAEALQQQFSLRFLTLSYAR